MGEKEGGKRRTNGGTAVGRDSIPDSSNRNVLRRSRVGRRGRDNRTSVAGRPTRYRQSLDQKREDGETDHGKSVKGQLVRRPSSFEVIPLQILRVGSTMGTEHPSAVV